MQNSSLVLFAPVDLTIVLLNLGHFLMLLIKINLKSLVPPKILLRAICAGEHTRAYFLVLKYQILKFNTVISTTTYPQNSMKILFLSFPGRRITAFSVTKSFDFSIIYSIGVLVPSVCSGSLRK